jgi:diguanylate cyclase (GGDEF)-like protein
LGQYRVHAPLGLRFFEFGAVWDDGHVRSWIDRIVRVDYADPETSRRAQTLNALMLASIPVALLAAILVLPYQNGPISSVFLVLTSAAFAILIRLAHQGQLVLALGLFTVFLLVVTVAQPLLTGDLSTNPLLIPLSTVMLVYVYPVRQWYIVVLWVVAALVLLQVGTNDVDTYELPRFLWLLNAALATILTVIVVTYAAHQMAEAVRREASLARQLSAREAVLLRLEELANSDPLTGFLNRRSLYESLNAVGTRCAFAVIDIDSFKAVNDVHSHAAGDAMLVDFSAIVAEIAQPQDLLFRLGGDEFLVARPGAGATELGQWLHQLRDRVRGHAWPEIPDGSVITFSAGVVNRADMGVEAAMRRADQALYTAKAQGRDAIVVVD